MVESSSDEFIENLVEYIREKPDLVSNLEGLLKDNEEFKKINKEFKELTIEDVSALLKSDKNLLDTVVGYFTENKKDLEALLEQASKVRDMKEKLEALGDQLLINKIIGGAAFTTLTGALAGTLAIGGVAGALVTGGAALVGFFALIAMAAIVYAVYQHRGEIKENVDKSIDKVKEYGIACGKAVKSFVKDVIDELTWRKTNFSRLEKEFINNMIYPENDEESKKAQDKIRIIKMLKNEGQQSAIQKLVKDGIIEKFSEKRMARLVEKGKSTHEEDMQELLSLMKDFQPAIMAIGDNKIEKVEKKVDKAQKMKPSSEVVTTAGPSQPFPDQSLEKGQ